MEAATLSTAETLTHINRGSSDSGPQSPIVANLISAGNVNLQPDWLSALPEEIKQRIASFLQPCKAYIAFQQLSKNFAKNHITHQEMHRKLQDPLITGELRAYYQQHMDNHWLPWFEKIKKMDGDIKQAILSIIIGSTADRRDTLVSFSLFTDTLLSGYCPKNTDLHLLLLTSQGVSDLSTQLQPRDFSWMKLGYANREARMAYVGISQLDKIATVFAYANRAFTRHPGNKGDEKIFLASLITSLKQYWCEQNSALEDGIKKEASNYPALFYVGEQALRYARQPDAL